jgi:hypothetical protein
VLPEADRDQLEMAIAAQEELRGDVLALAGTWLRDRAGQIDDDELRARFLEDVPVRRALRELGRAR